MSTFFGADGRGELSLGTFRAFVADLRGELLRLEFEYYDWRKQVGRGRGGAGCKGRQALGGAAGARLALAGRQVPGPTDVPPPPMTCCPPWPAPRRAPPRQGWICGRDFAHSIVACARLKHVDSYLDKCQVGVRPRARACLSSDACACLRA